MQVAEVAYLVLAHAGHEQLLRLLRTLRRGSPQAAIALHFDAKREAPASALLRDLDVLMVEPRVSVNWGDASQVDAMIAATEFTSKHVDFEWLTFLSGQDYPLRPLTQIEADLKSADCDAFVRAGPAGSYAYRYDLRYWNLPRFSYDYLLPAKVRRAAAAMRQRFNAAQTLVRIEPSPRGMPSRLGVRLPGTPFSEGFVCFKGSQWVTLNRRAVASLLRFGRVNPYVLRHYRQTICPDESYIQSVIWNDRSLRVRDDHRRFILWDEHKLAHPVTLTMHHLELLLASGKDFGRKFDMAVDRHVLDALDRVVLGGYDMH